MYYLCENGNFLFLRCGASQFFDINVADCIIPDSTFNCEYRCRTPVTGTDDYLQTSSEPEVAIPTTDADLPQTTDYMETSLGPEEAIPMTNTESDVLSTLEVFETTEIELPSTTDEPALSTGQESSTIMPETG